MLKLTKYAHDSIPLLEVIIYLLCSYEARAFGFISHFYRKCLKTFLIYITMKYVFRQLNIKTIKERYYTVILIIICIALILWLGIKEKNRHTNRLNKIPIRININGIRGKSTITRMIYSVLRETIIMLLVKPQAQMLECCIGLLIRNTPLLENHKARILVNNVTLCVKLLNKKLTL